MKRGKIILDLEEEEDERKTYLMEVLQGDQDIVCGILSRLPVKSLLICKSVCKEWRRLITSPYFMNRLHLNKSKENPSFIARYRDDSSQVVNFDEDSFDEKALPLSYGSASPNFTYGVVAAPKYTCFFDGFICWVHLINGLGGKFFSRGYMIYICNPATRELLLLRQCFYDPPSQPFMIHIAVACFGPPTSTSTNQVEADYYKYYKVYAFLQQDFCREYHLEVYSSMTKSWKAVGRLSEAPVLGPELVSVNGTIYWLHLPRRQDCIFAIDWDRENVIRRIRLPPLPPWHARRRLLRFEGCLSCILFGAVSFDLWVLKEEDLWVKRCGATFPVKTSLSAIAARKNEIYFTTVSSSSSSSSSSEFSYKSLSFDVDSKTWKEDVNWLANISERGYTHVSAFSETLLPCY